MSGRTTKRRSAAKAGATSALWLHDATNAYLSMQHEVAKQAANEMALKEVDKFLFDPRISLGAVTISVEEGEIVIFGETRHVAWGFQCSVRSCEGNVFSFSTRTGGFRDEWADARAPC